MKGNNSGITEIVKGKEYLVRPYLGKDPLTGKYLRAKARKVYGTLNEARAVRDEVVQNHEQGLRLDADSMLFGSYAVEWIHNRQICGDISDDTAKRDASNVRTLNKYLAHVHIADITPDMVRRLLVTIKQDKTKDKGTYSNATLRLVFNCLKQICEDAVDAGYILKNPCAKIKAPKLATPERNSLTLSEASRLLVCLDAEEQELLTAFYEKEQRQIKRGNGFGRIELRGLSSFGRLQAVRIALATGVRRGEAFGLVWGCVNLKDQYLEIRQSLTASGVRKTPKTQASLRRIALDEGVCRHLKEWKDFQRKQLHKLGLTLNEATPVCCSDIGGYADLRYFSRWWCDFRNKYGFEGLKFHELRHSQATLLLANGADVKTVQARLGHSNASITLNWYAHAIPANDAAAADMLGSLLTPKQTKQIQIASEKTA